MLKYIITFVFVAVLGAVTWEGLSFLYFPPGDENDVVVFEVKPGMSFQRVAQRLKQDGLVLDDFKLKLLARFTKHTTKIRVGEYELNSGMTPTEILGILSSGQSIQHSFTVQEGLNMYEVADVIERKGFGTRKEFLRLCRDKKFIKKVLGKEAYSLEGYLFPETYNVTKYTSEKDIIRMMVSRFFEVFDSVLSVSRISHLNRHEIVILASIIEKETGAPEERPRISSVFHNRLKKKMKLQTDPTIIYGILDETGEHKKNIRKKDILRYTKFNTYRVKALPHGPIANPGKEALMATVMPESTPFLYFVSRNDGTHVFTKTYKDHWREVQKFQLNRKARQGKSWRDLKKRRKKVAN